MKTGKLSFLFTLSAIVMVWFAMVPSAMAGSSGNYPVSISINGNNIIASGSFADTRNSTDPRPWLYCSITANKGETPIGFCDASNGIQMAFCTTIDPGEIQVISSLSGDSFVSFSYTTPGYDCSSISSSTGSIMAPKTK